MRICSTGATTAFRWRSDIYARLATGPARSSIVLPLFEVELLITLREKELSMDWTASFARAQALGAELPAGVDAARYLALVDAIPPDGMGTPEMDDLAFRRARQPFVPRIDGEMAWLSSGPLQAAVREYLSISIDCKYLNRARAGGRPPRLSAVRAVPPNTPPLIAYRLATCDTLNRAALEDLRTQVPAFVETSAFVARLDVADARRTGGGGARALLAEVYNRFSHSSSVTYLNANFRQTIGDCTEALRFYDETLEMQPVHENALLGRTVCLTFLSRGDEAIAAATHMINLRTPNTRDAYYWRAWNYHARQALTAARLDIDQAKHIGWSADIARLAGIIEHDQDDLDLAEKDLTEARNASGSDCIARWYLGLVAMKQRRWPVTAGHFEDAMNCYSRAADYSEGGLRAMEARTDVDPVFQASQIEGFKAALREDRTQQYAAAFNAANHYARAGNLEKARPLLEIAAKDPALEKLVAELRRIIGKSAAAP